MCGVEDAILRSAHPTRLAPENRRLFEMWQDARMFGSGDLTDGERAAVREIEWDAQAFERARLALDFAEVFCGHHA